MKILLIDENFDPSTIQGLELRKLYELYLKTCKKKTVFDTIIKFRVRNPTLYIIRCQELVKDVKCITFREDRLTFEVRITRCKKRISLGTHTNFDDALEALQEWFKLESQK